MQNKHGLECPLNWDKLPSHYNWIALDANGEIYSYEYKPRILNDPHWRSVDFNFWFLGTTDPPADFTQCIWERPK